MSYKIKDNNAIIIIEGDLSKDDNYSSYENDIALVVSEHVHNIVLDLKNIETIDTLGISIILKLYKNINALKGSVSFINANKEVKTILDTLKISELLSQI